MGWSQGTWIRTPPNAGLTEKHTITETQMSNFLSIRHLKKGSRSYNEIQELTIENELHPTAISAKAVNEIQHQLVATVVEYSDESFGSGLRLYTSLRLVFGTWLKNRKM